MGIFIRTTVLSCCFIENSTSVMKVLYLFPLCVLLSPLSVVSQATEFTSKDDLKDFLLNGISGRNSQCSENKFKLNGGLEFKLFLNSDSCNEDELKGENLLIQKSDGRVVVRINGDETVLLNNKNVIDESIFNDVFPEFDQVSVDKTPAPPTNTGNKFQAVSFLISTLLFLMKMY